MKRLSALLIPAALVAALMVSCSHSDNQESSDTIAFQSMGGSAAFRLQGSAGDFDRDSDLVYFDTVAMVLPVKVCGHDLSALRDTIMRAAFDTVAVDINDAMQSFFKASASETGYQLVEVPVVKDDEAEADGITVVSGSVFSLTTDMLTYRVTNFTGMPGAAHGVSLNTYITYSLSEGRIITLADLFTAEGLEKLPDMIARRANALKSSLGRTSITELPSNGNFYIDLDGDIVFVYPPYEVASYAQGEICVPFYPYQLTEYMTDNALRLFHLHSDR